MTTPIEILDEMEKEIQQRRLTKTLNREYTGNQFEIDSSNLGILHKTKERIEKECGWIPVSEKYPEDYEYILGFDGGLHYILHGYAKESGDFEWLNFIGNITHWMPLPTPPNQ